ncbi:methylmalonyl-CoA epimerase [Rhizobium sp. Root708]|uniref:methylmalonyl-CoA epimerase n=1 Tax=Rhizobium sp. Root708 TaxID=1736592 RepID=UPI0006F45BD0|nr:methylmalonyl-CoA epimerase [Rhizobium sp. Root708]KRB49114.1 methylmalonyl-CoA epimerase [Rhizobium sp. Root708]
MLTWLNHIAIAVPDLSKAAAQYKSLGANVSDPKDLPEHGVTVVFVTIPNTKIELMHPLGQGSPIEAFLERNPSGGIHHLCFEVAEIGEAADKLRDIGVRVLGDGTPKLGAHDKPVLFAHPKDFQGALVEFEQI